MSHGSLRSVLICGWLMAINYSLLVVASDWGGGAQRVYGDF